MTIGEALRRFRISLGLSQKQLAKSIGISCQAYQAWEYDKADPKAKLLIAMADIYNVSTDYLLGRSDMPNPTNFDEREVREAFAIRDKVRQIQQLKADIGLGQVAL